MPINKLKDPDVYPPSFRRALAKGPGTHFILFRRWEREARLEQARFNVFRRSLREFTAHSLAQVEARHSIRTKLLEVFAEEGHGWELWVVIKPYKILPQAVLEGLERSLL